MFVLLLTIKQEDVDNGNAEREREKNHASMGSFVCVQGDRCILYIPTSLPSPSPTACHIQKPGKLQTNQVNKANKSLPEKEKQPCLIITETYDDYEGRGRLKNTLSPAITFLSVSHLITTFFPPFFLAESGRQAFVESDGIRVLYNSAQDVSDSREVESLIMLASLIMRKCCPRNRLPLENVLSAITFPLPHSDVHIPECYTLPEFQGTSQSPCCKPLHLADH